MLSLRKLALTSEIVAITIILPFWIQLVLGPLFFGFVIYYFCGRKWAAGYLALVGVTNVPSLLQSFTIGSAALVTVSSSSGFVTGLAQSQPLAFDAFTILVWIVDGVFLFQFFFVAVRLSRRIRDRVPRHLWAAN